MYNDDLLNVFVVFETQIHIQSASLWKKSEKEVGRLKYIVYWNITFKLCYLLATVRDIAVCVMFHFFTTLNLTWNTHIFVVDLVEPSAIVWLWTVARPCFVFVVVFRFRIGLVRLWSWSDITITRLIRSTGTCWFWCLGARLDRFLSFTWLMYDKDKLK